MFCDKYEEHKELEMAWNRVHGVHREDEDGSNVMLRRR
jgi:hypothetical protein